MELIAVTEATDFIQKLLAFLPPHLVIRRHVLVLTAARKHNVAHLQIRNRPAVRRGLFIQLLRHPQRSLSHFESRATVSDDAGIYFLAVDHHRVIAHFWREGVVLRRQKVHRDHNERIVFRDQIAPRLQVFDSPFQHRDPVPQPGFPLRRSLGILLLPGSGCDPFLPSRHHRIRRLRALRPAIAGEWLVMCRVHDRIRHRLQPVAIGSIGHHIHVRLHEKDPPAALRAEIQNCVAIVDIVFGQQLVKGIGVPADPGRFVFVKHVEPWRNLRLLQQARKRRQNF